MAEPLTYEEIRAARQLLREHDTNHGDGALNCVFCETHDEGED